MLMVNGVSSVVDEYGSVRHAARHRSRVAARRCLLTATAGFFALLPPGHAEAAVPGSALTLARRTCSVPVTDSAGPWKAGSRRLVAAIAWSDGSPRACLVVMRVGTTTSTVVATMVIDAGFSERYDERYSPGIRPDVLRFPDGTIGVVVDHTAMNESGGGGTETTLWRLKGTTLSIAFSAVLNGARTINEAVESPCPPDPPLRLSSTNGVVRLHVTGCANGVSTPQTFRFDGTRFR